MNKKGIQSILEILCKLLVAFGIVFLVLVTLDQSGLPNAAKATIGMAIGIVFIKAGDFVDRRLSPKWHKFFVLFFDDGTPHRSNNKTTNKEANRCRPTPWYPYKETSQNQQSTNETEHAAKSPLENPTNKIHRHLLCSYLTGLYHLLRRSQPKGNDTLFWLT